MNPASTVNSFSRCLAILHGWIAEPSGMAEEVTPEVFAQHHLEAVCYYYNHTRLPEPWQSQFRDIYRAQSVRVLKQEHEMSALFAVLKRHQVRFCPIKGADLAYRYYPAPALRPHGDLDILIHPEDCDRAWDLLQQHGWHSDFQCRHAHHYHGLDKNGVYLELHFHLPRFQQVPVTEIWALMQQHQDGSYRLPPELNLLLVFLHAYGHEWQVGIRMLLDMEYIVAGEAIDPGKLEALTSQWHLPSPLLVFATFPELFPQYKSVRNRYPDDILADFRILATQGTNFNDRRYECMMSKEECYSMKWITSHLSGFMPQCVRMKYHLPSGNYGKLLACYWREVVLKGKLLWKFRSGTDDPALKKHIQRQERIQSFLQNSDYRCGD